MHSLTTPGMATDEEMPCQQITEERVSEAPSSGRSSPTHASPCSLALRSLGTDSPSGQTGQYSACLRGLWGCEVDRSPWGTHVMVSIMSRPISTQQWAWSVLGWVRPDTQ